MLKPHRVLVALGALSIASTHAYLIDADCGDNTAFVQTHIDHAFELAANTLNELNKVPRDPQIEHVFQLLFGYSPENRPGTSRGGIETRLTNLVSLAGLGTQLTGQLSTDVKFYCTTNRIEKRKDGRYYNKDANLVYAEGQMTDRFNECFKVSTNAPAMVTINPDGGPSEIQICPWYLTVERGFKYVDFKSVNAVVWGGLHTIGDALSGIKNFFKRPIDAFQHFDITILHELTHTTQAGNSKDMEYGWKDCLDLAQAWVAENAKPQPDAEKDPQRNADSISFMASAVEVTRAGIKIRDDGRLDPPKKKSSRRDAVMYPVTWVA